MRDIELLASRTSIALAGTPHSYRPNRTGSCPSTIGEARRTLLVHPMLTKQPYSWAVVLAEHLDKEIHASCVAVRVLCAERRAMKHSTKSSRAWDRGHRRSPESSNHCLCN
jgi:hypothetical protein